MRFPGEGQEEGPGAAARPSLTVTAGDRLTLSGMPEQSRGPRRGLWRTLVFLIFFALAAIGAASIVQAVAPVFSG